MADGKDCGMAAGALRSDDVTRAEGDARGDFMSAVASALDDLSFVRLTLGKFRGLGETRKAVATLVSLKGEQALKLVTSFPRKDETKTFRRGEIYDALDKLVGHDYWSATLFTTTRDMRLDYSRKGVPRLAIGKASLGEAEVQPHDRQKAYLVPPLRPYLKALDVSDRDGRVKPTMQGKYRQICRFIEIAADHFKEAQFEGGAPLSIVDIGSGKGYLTFGLFDYVTTTLGRPCTMTGVEIREDLAASSNKLANDLLFGGLSFVAAKAADAAVTSADIVIALHACDTATDDALAFGVKRGARLIFAAPCCQHEIAPQIRDTDAGLAGLTKYNLLKQRYADLVTDAARALLLEAAGYRVKLIEFVSSEHSSKNILIAAVKSKNIDRIAAKKEFHALQALSGFARQSLASQLKDAE
jgi:hypothetical protein